VSHGTEKWRVKALISTEGSLLPHTTTYSGKAGAKKTTTKKQQQQEPPLTHIPPTGLASSADFASQKATNKTKTSTKPDAPLTELGRGLMPWTPNKSPSLSSVWYNTGRRR
jgi:hypothetical protein